MFCILQKPVTSKEGGRSGSRLPLTAIPSSWSPTLPTRLLLRLLDCPACSPEVHPLLKVQLFHTWSLFPPHRVNNALWLSPPSFTGHPHPRQGQPLVPAAPPVPMLPQFGALPTPGFWIIFSALKPSSSHLDCPSWLL